MFRVCKFLLLPISIGVVVHCENLDESQRLPIFKSANLTNDTILNSTTVNNIPDDGNDTGVGHETSVNDIAEDENEHHNDTAVSDDEHNDDATDDHDMAGGDDDFLPKVSPLLNWPEGKCIDNITLIMQDIALKGPFELKKYHVCPNRTFEIGLDELGHCCLDGKYPPFLPLRGYSEFICGDDGWSTNNCVISGGNVQISSAQDDYPGETIKGVVFRGFTFQKAQFINVLLANEGDILFDDCVFKVRLLLVIFLMNKKDSFKTFSS
jgi:hypothetical protein